MKIIITHAGSAHRDEVLACAVICYLQQIERILRVEEVTPEVLEKFQPAFVVDIGGKYDVQGQPVWLDHHQMPREQATSAFDLTVKYLAEQQAQPGIHAYLSRPGGIIEQVSILDHQGPMVYAAKYGIDPKKGFCQLLGPIESAVIRAFEGNGAITDKSGLGLNALRSIGMMVWEAAADMLSQLDVVRRKAEIENDVMIVLDGDQNFDPDATRQIRDEIVAKGTAINVLVTKDNRGMGLTLYRFDDYPGINFSKIEKEPEVHFAHRGGFIAKTRSADLGKAMELIQKARTS